MACNLDPSECPSGKTCWPVDTTTLAFACLNSKPGAGQGAACTPTVGQPDCGDAMFCFTPATPAGQTGVCSAYCDPTKPMCAAGTTCLAVEIPFPDGGAGPMFHICYGATPLVDGGTPTDAAASFDSAVPDAALEAAAPLDAADEASSDGATE